MAADTSLELVTYYQQPIWILYLVFISHFKVLITLLWKYNRIGMID